MQHDVQEFNRLLQDNIEKKMRGTPAEDAIKQLFVGRMKSYIKCMNVDFESSRSEDYYGKRVLHDQGRGCATVNKQAIMGLTLFFYANK